MVKKLAVLEDPVDVKPAGYDHVFSFCSNPADSFPDDYLDSQKVTALYDDTYEKLCHFLEEHPLREIFSYRGVDLLWCYKKIIFDYAHFARIRHETFKAVREKYRPAQFSLLHCGRDPEYPYLSEILEASFLEEHSEIRLLGRKQDEDFPSVTESLGHRIWPSRLAKGRFDQAEVAIFSDFEKSKSLLRILDSEKCVLFCNVAGPRTIWRAWSHRVGLYQIAYRRNQGSGYTRKADELISQLSQRDVFSGFQLGGLDGSPLLGNKLRELFQTSLARLLFEIDQAHRFFKEARLLRSILLDEDTLPSKNAFCQVARQYQVTTFVESHGAFCHKVGFLPLTADHIFVWGNAQKERLVKWGCPPSRIIVSGRSKYQEYGKLNDKKLREKVVRDFKLDASRKIILMAFTPLVPRRIIFENLWKRVIGQTLQTVGEVLKETQAQFILKLHPRDKNERQYTDWVQRSRLHNQGTIVRHYDPLILSRASDLVIVYMSTFAVDAFAMAKPVICVQDRSNETLEEFRPFNVFHYADTAEELKKAIRQILEEGKVYPPLWETARRECLNEGSETPMELIGRYLIEPHFSYS